MPGKIKHGLTHTRLYSIWLSMKKRCYFPANDNYKNYGGKGIGVCDEWRNKRDGFQNFYKWAMENGYQDHLRLDRIEGNGNYEPSNCRWITQRENCNNKCNNKCNNIWFTYLGETDTLKNLCRKYDKRYDAVHRRIRKLGLPIEEAFEKTKRPFAS